MARQYNARHYNPHEYHGTQRSDIAVLLSMCLFALLALGAFVAIKIVPHTQLQFGSFLSNFTQPEKGKFTLGAVKLGTTMDKLTKMHRDAVKGVTADGAITLSFTDRDGRYIVWYGEEGPQHVAYKARQSRELRNTTEDAFVSDIAVRYGAPSLASCSRRVTDGLRDCQFSWWIPGELRLDVNSRQDTYAAHPKLKITMQITDTRREGQLRRASALSSRLSQTY